MTETRWETPSAARPPHGFDPSRHPPQVAPTQPYRKATVISSARAEAKTILVFQFGLPSVFIGNANAEQFLKVILRASTSERELPRALELNKPINPNRREMKVLRKPLACKTRARRQEGSVDQHGLFIRKQLLHRGRVGRSPRAHRAVTELINGCWPWSSVMGELRPLLKGGNGL